MPAPNPRLQRTRFARGTASFCCLAWLLIVRSVAGQQDHRAPEGFGWRELSDVKAAILLPEGWKAEIETTNGNVIYVETERNTPTPSRFSFSVIKGPNKAGSPEKLADDFLKGISIVYRAEKTWGDEKGPFITRAGFFVSSGDQASRVKAFSQIIVNKTTGTVYVLGFEAVQKEWDAKWNIGQVVCGVVRINDEY